MLFTKDVAVISHIIFFVKKEMCRDGEARQNMSCSFSHRRPLCAKLSPTTASLSAFACVLACKGTPLLGSFKLNQETSLDGQHADACSQFRV